jgi:hypothetical protein
MNNFIPALIVLFVGTPLCVWFYGWYTRRWFKKHGTIEENLADIFRSEEEV